MNIKSRKDGVFLKVTIGRNVYLAWLVSRLLITNETKLKFIKTKQWIATIEDSKGTSKNYIVDDMYDAYNGGDYFGNKKVRELLINKAVEFATRKPKKQ